MLDLSVRDATPDDLASIQAIYAHHVHHGTGTFEEVPPDLAEMRARFDAVRDAGLPYLAAVRDGAVVGYAYAGFYHKRSAYRFTLEDSIYVDARTHRSGIGRALLAELLRRCEAGRGGRWSPSSATARMPDRSDCTAPSASSLSVR